MEASNKNSMGKWIFLGIVVPTVFMFVTIFLGRSYNAIPVYVVSFVVFGALAYRANMKYLASKASAVALNMPTAHEGSGSTFSPQPIRNPVPAFGFGIIGAALGFGVGFLTRPSLLGEKYPLALLWDRVPAEFTSMQTDFRLHMMIATAIGFIAMFALAKLIAAIR
jgi:hypothetical protein